MRLSANHNYWPSLITQLQAIAPYSTVISSLNSDPFQGFITQLLSSTPAATSPTTSPATSPTHHYLHRHGPHQDILWWGLVSWRLPSSPTMARLHRPLRIWGAFQRTSTDRIQFGVATYCQLPTLTLWKREICPSPNTRPCSNQRTYHFCLVHQLEDHRVLRLAPRTAISSSQHHLFTTLQQMSMGSRRRHVRVFQIDFDFPNMNEICYLHYSNIILIWDHKRITSNYNHVIPLFSHYTIVSFYRYSHIIKYRELRYYNFNITSLYRASFPTTKYSCIILYFWILYYIICVTLYLH